jgi:hypothetical protein
VQCDAIEHQVRLHDVAFHHDAVRVRAFLFIDNLKAELFGECRVDHGWRAGVENESTGFAADVDIDVQLGGDDVQRQFDGELVGVDEGTFGGPAWGLLGDHQGGAGRKKQPA